MANLPGYYDALLAALQFNTSLHQLTLYDTDCKPKADRSCEDGKNACCDEKGALREPDRCQENQSTYRGPEPCLFMVCIKWLGVGDAERQLCFSF